MSEDQGAGLAGLEKELGCSVCATNCPIPEPFHSGIPYVELSLIAGLLEFRSVPSFSTSPLRFLTAYTPFAAPA